MTPQSLGFTPAEATVLQGGNATFNSQTGAACLDSYGGALVPVETLRLMLYHIRAAIDLGLAEHARRQFAGLLELIDRHPELVQTGKPARALADARRADRRRSNDFFVVIHPQ